MQGVGGESDGSGYGKWANVEVRKCWWGYVEANEGGGKSAGKEARKSAREEDWMGERARGMYSRVKGGLWKRGRMDEG